ncbi:MAG: hypothetical protein LUG61_08500 [Lachnospiraceae bacterium]|nr:hypothetical protein [Lachnospiraceae bacterium]
MAKKKKKEKMLTDKGFELFYGNLSTRRQLIRNLWMSGIGLAVFIAAWIQGSLNKNILLILIAVFTMSQAYQIGRNYLAWTEEKKKLEKQKRAQEQQEKQERQRQEQEQREKQRQEQQEQQEKQRQEQEQQNR